MEQLPSGVVRTLVSNAGVPGTKKLGAPRSTQLFILPRSIKKVPGTLGDLVVRSKLSPRSGSAVVRQLFL